MSQVIKPNAGKNDTTSEEQKRKIAFDEQRSKRMLGFLTGHLLKSKQELAKKTDAVCSVDHVGGVLTRCRLKEKRKYRKRLKKGKPKKSRNRWRR